MRADVHKARIRVVYGCEMIEFMERPGGGILTVNAHKWNLEIVERGAGESVERGL
jgi:lauroyl/myristoyl acyltransferase